jgi:3-oxoadipate enol-lactonase
MPFIDVNNVSLRYELRAGSGPLLVLLHEMGGTLETWDDCVALIQDRATLRYDARGAGLSQKIMPPLNYDALIDDLDALLGALSIKTPVAIAGCAVGAAVAIGYAAKHAEKVAGLVLMSPATGIEPSKRAATLAIAEDIETGGLRARVDQRLDHSFPKALRSDERRVRDFRARALANDAASYGAYYRMLTDLDLSATLGQIRCPTLVLAGEYDGTRPPETVKAVASAIPCADFETVASGHVMPALTPELISQRIKKFLATLPAA